MPRAEVADGSRVEPEEGAGPRPSPRHRLEYGVTVIVRFVVRHVPRWIARALGTALGLAFYCLDAPHRRLARANLAHAFPARRRRELRAITRAVFIHFGRLVIEILRFSALPPDRMRGAFEFSGAERVHQAHRQGKGAIFVTGHFGWWELHAIAHGLALHPIAVVARALDNPLLHDLLERVRTCTGNTVIYRRGGLRRILKSLAANEGVAILIDQHIQPADAVVVDFFGRPAATTSAVAALALRTGAPVIPVFSLPLADGRYRFVYEAPVEPPAPDVADPVRDFTQRCTDVLEMYVRRNPQLWLWMHRRWRDIADPRAPGMLPTVGRDEPAGHMST